MTPKRPVYLRVMPIWFIGLLVVILVLSLSFNVVATLVVRQRDRDYDRILGAQSATETRFREAFTALEIIRDMGPTGPDPLPPCHFCEQGPGHWIDPKDKTCPAIVARQTILNLNRPAS